LRRLLHALRIQVFAEKGVFTIVAVEPFPNNYRILEQWLHGGNIYLVKKAVWLRDGEEVEFDVPDIQSNNDVTSMGGRITLTKRHLMDGKRGGKTLRVGTVRLDTLIKMFELEKVDLVKMDIEGAEYPVLTDPSLDLSKVENMIVEVHYRYGSREDREIMAALARQGFKLAPLYPESHSDFYHLLAYRGEMPW